MADLGRTYPESNGAMRGDVLPFWKAPRGPQGMFLNALLLLQGVPLLLLLAVCGNTANLLLARINARQREVGVRLAIGASPRRIVRLLVTESLAFAIPGAALGALLAIWGTQALRNVPIYSALPVKFQTEVDWMGLAFASALAIACAVAFGAAPAAQLARLDPQTALKEGARAPAGSGCGTRSWRRKSRWRSPSSSLPVSSYKASATPAISIRDSGATGSSSGTYDIAGREVKADEAAGFARRLLEKLRENSDIESARALDLRCRSTSMACPSAVSASRAGRVPMACSTAPHQHRVARLLRHARYSPTAG